MLDSATVWRVLGDVSRYQCSRLVAVGLIASVGVVLALTGGAGAIAPANAQTWWMPGYLQQLTYDGYLRSELTTMFGTLQELANVVLFAPVGLFASLTWRSLTRGMVFGIGLSVFVERVQPFIGRPGSFGDLLHNALGTTIGAAVALMTLRTMRHRQAPPTTVPAPAPAQAHD